MFIVGYCPMGCGRTLFVADGGHITCSYVNCERPAAVDELLEDREIEHLVTFEEAEFTIRHPLAERLDDALLTCQLHQHIVELRGPPVQLGKYRARPAGNGAWAWDKA